MRHSKFNEVLTNRGEEVYAGTGVDQEIREKLNDWFWFREVCASDDKFLHFWHRNIKLYYPKFLLLVENELNEIPELTDYIEAVHEVVKMTGSSISNKSGNDKTEHTGNDKVDRIGTNKVQTTGTDTTTTSESGSASTEQTSPTKHKDVSLTGPQSQSYTSAGGEVPALNWDYISGQNQSEDTAGATSSSNSSSGSNTRTANLQDLTTIDTLDTTTYNSTNKTTYGSQDETENESNNVRDTMRSGRNQNEVDLRKKVWDYVSDSIALNWFKSKLEVCFMGILEEEE